MLRVSSKSFIEAKGVKLYMDSMYINSDYTPITAVKLNPFKIVGFPYRSTVAVEGVGISKRYKLYCLKVLNKHETKVISFKNKNVLPVYFKVGDFVDIQSISKGKGFQGVIKRWGFAKQPQTHGSMSHRRGGSYGNREWPAEIQKGKKMPGHMGNDKTTVQNLLIVSTLPYKNIIFVKGAVPGPKNIPLKIFLSKKKYKNS